VSCSGGDLRAVRMVVNINESGTDEHIMEDNRSILLVLLVMGVVVR